MPSKLQQIVHANWAVEIANVESAVWLQEDDCSVLIKVRVKPRGRKNTIDGVRGEALIISVTAAPEDGKANVSVIEVLSRAFDHPKSSITVARVHTSRDKIIRLENISAKDVREKLNCLSAL